MISEFFEKFFHISYDEFFKWLTDKLFGPTGAEIVSWICLSFSVYLIMRRRVNAAGIIIMLYLVAFAFAYIPPIVKMLRG